MLEMLRYLSNFHNNIFYQTTAKQYNIAFGFRPNKWITEKRLFGISSKDRWQSKFEAIKAWVEEHGTAERIDDAKLVKWLQRQRSQSSKLSKEQKDGLDSLKIILRQQHDDKWDNHYAKLSAFHQEYGHTNLSTNYNRSLGLWVQRQRMLHRNVIKGGISKERVEKLQELDFDFDTRSSIWKSQYQALHKYKMLTGNCLIPNKYEENQSLATWVDLQRQQYKKKIDGKKSSMSDKRKNRLEAIGFVWNALDARWQEQFEDMREHIHANGFANKLTPTLRLRAWLNYQKSIFERQQLGEKTSLTEERLKKLQSLGFCLQVERYPFWKEI